MVEIIPAILAQTKEEFLEMLAKVQPHTERVHVDIMDGTLTQDKTYASYDEVSAADPSIQFEIHLMTTEPMAHMTDWLATPADRICVHAEAEDVPEALHRIRSEGRSAGLAVNPKTPLEAILEFLPMIDYIQFMTVSPGQYGGEFVEGVLQKIDNFHNDHFEVIIAADGSMHEGVAQAAVEAGASRLILGSHIFAEGRDVGEALTELKEEFNEI